MSKPKKKIFKKNLKTEKKQKKMLAVIKEHINDYLLMITCQGNNYL